MTFQRGAVPGGTGIALQRRMSLVSGSTAVLDESRTGAWFARPAALRAGEAGVPALHRMAELALAAGGDAPIARRALRVPASAFVPVSSRLLQAPVAPLMLNAPIPTATANDNQAPAAPQTSRVAKALREALFLVILAATLYGAFYTGRQHAFQKVIVVPDAVSLSSVVT